VRVVHLISGDLWAGAETATYHLLVELSRRDSVHVGAILLNEGELARRLRGHPAIETIVEDEARQSFATLARRVRRHCADADLVHAHRYKENFLAALTGRPWVATQHGRPEPTAGWRSALQRGLVHRLDQVVKRRRASCVIAVSSEVEEWLRAHAHQSRVARVGNGIPDFAAAQRVRPWSERPLRVGVLARLFPVKGLDLAIEALAATRGADLELEIIGDGPERAALEQRARELGCAARVKFVGFDPNPSARVAEWRALLVTSLHEGNPISVLEALALSTPVISGALRGIDEILAGEGGLLLPDRDPQRWARAIEAVACDDAAGADLSARARRRFSAEWGVDVAVAEMLRVYREILASAERS
jgi:glycosyltransferase involved in cell wall biosynthesis